MIWCTDLESVHWVDDSTVFTVGISFLLKNSEQFWSSDLFYKNKLLFTAYLFKKVLLQLNYTFKIELTVYYHLNCYKEGQAWKTVLLDLLKKVMFRMYELWFLICPLRSTSLILKLSCLVWWNQFLRAIIKGITTHPDFLN